jgi:hypothetical protein
MSDGNHEQPDYPNVTYIDEFNRERWLLKLRLARESGRVAVFGAIQPTDAIIIPFPTPNKPPDGAA